MFIDYQIHGVYLFPMYFFNYIHSVHRYLNRTSPMSRSLSYITRDHRSLLRNDLYYDTFKFIHAEHVYGELSTEEMTQFLGSENKVKLTHICRLYFIVFGKLFVN